MKKNSVDTPFLLVTCALVVFGLLIFTSAALGLLARDGASFTSVAVNQLLLGLVCGGIALWVLSRLDYRIWAPYTPYFFGLAMMLTALTLVPGVGLELKGASRWLSLGPITFQPIEILKLAVVAFLAAIFAARMKHVHTLMGGVLPLALVVGSAAGLLLLQPDTDGAAILAMASLGMLFAAGGRAWHILAIVLIGVGALGIAAYQRPYLMERFTTFLNPEADTRGAGYQLNQSLIAVGSGEWVGKGFGQSIEKFSYLPEPIGDSIFAVAAEEFGFVGSVMLIVLYASVALLGLRIAARAPDPFGGLLVVGIVLLIIGQSFMNIASIIGLIPLSGLPLIFVSHGGTALAISLAEIGILLSVSRRMKH